MSFSAVSAGISSNKTAEAPNSIAFFMNLWPSVCVPFIATNKCPCSILRLSILMPLMSLSVLPTIFSGLMFLSKSFNFISCFSLLFVLVGFILLRGLGKTKFTNHSSLNLVAWCKRLFYHSATSRHHNLYAAAF